jgi:MFS family permease
MENKPKLDTKASHYKNVIHGFAVSIATTVAEPATILPLIITYFGGGSLLIGFFSSLLRGGGILVQIVAAFYAQAYPLMMPYLKRVFLARFLAWMWIGVAILLFGKSNSELTLFSIGVGLFIFSFAAGFGTIYFKEVQAKVFTHKFRGKTMAVRQFFMGVGAIGSGAIAGFVLENYEAPFSFGILFVVSALIMCIGIIAFSTIDEPKKIAIKTKEQHFKRYLLNSKQLLKEDKKLKNLILSQLLSYGYLFVLPFIILDAQKSIELSGSVLGTFVSLQMLGAMLSNIIWGKLAYSEKNNFVIIFAYVVMVMALILTFIANQVWMYSLVFFLIGAGMDGFRLAYNNLIVIIASDVNRPTYLALQANLTSIGLFFSIPGGFLITITGFNSVLAFSLIVMVWGLFFALKRCEY